MANDGQKGDNGFSLQNEPFYADAWLVEPRLNRISRDGTAVSLEPKTMAALVFLAERKGRVVSREELYASVWGGTFVTDNTLSRTVSRLRRALSDDWQSPRYLETISKSGYRWVAPVEPVRRSEAGVDSEPVAVPAPARRRWPAFARVTTLALAVAVLYLAAARAPDAPPTALVPSPLLTLVGQQVGSVLSPDGARVAFAWNGSERDEAEANWEIYIKVVGAETLLRVTETEAREAYPAWSPDGGSLAFVRIEASGRAGIFRAPATGGVATRLADCTPEARHLTWSPDGQTLAFSDLGSDETRRRLVALDLSSRTTRTLTTPTDTASGDSRPVFSPDGRSLLFTRGSSLRRDDMMLLALDDVGEPRVLASEGDIRGHDWTPSGDAVIYSSNRSGQFALWRIGHEGGEPERLPIHEPWVTEPSLARDRGRLIYRKFSDVIDLWSLELDEHFRVVGERSRLVPSTRTEFLPALSRDGSRIAFVSNRSGTPEVWTSRLDSEELMRHTDLKGRIPGGLVWTPDGKSLVFDAATANGLDLYLVDADSAAPRRLTFDPSDELNPIFSRDGSTLYFASNRSGRFEIWKTSWSGREVDESPRQVTTDGGFVAREDPEGALYYTKPDGTVWQRRAGSNERDRKLGELHPYDWAGFEPVRGGTVFVARGPSAIAFHDSQDETLRVLYSLDRPMPYLGSPITLTADGRRLVFAEIAYSDDEVMLLELPR